MSTLKESFAVLEAASSELRQSRLFFKLLEAVLKTGNRMNNGTFRGGNNPMRRHKRAQECIKSDDSDEHMRSLGVQVVSGLSNELENVRRAALLDTDTLTGTVAKLGHALDEAGNILRSEMKNIPPENGFHQTLRSFIQNAEVDVTWSREEEKRIMALVKSTADYFHGKSGKDEALRLFIIVRDFLIILDKVCKEVPLKPSRAPRNGDAMAIAPVPRQRLFPAIADRQVDTWSSDDNEP
ncbi:formin-like protein 5 [Salvia divinorum]|uniref:Formin-like protein 5 n=1 Tax=Salvia divinorum TaxID=28513 RepID=A0ABD1G1E4_SALDI